MPQESIWDYLAAHDGTIYKLSIAKWRLKQNITKNWRQVITPMWNKLSHLYARPELSLFNQNEVVSLFHYQGTLLVREAKRLVN